MPQTTHRPLADAHAEFMLGPVSIIAASHDAHLSPNLARAVGCRLDRATSALTIFFAAAQAQAVLADVRANAKLAVVFSLPSTDEALQLKSFDASRVPLQPGDVEVVRDYHQRMLVEIEPLGFDRRILQAIFSVDAADIVAVRCTPDTLFEQTPGPNAGNLLQVAG